MPKKKGGKGSKVVVKKEISKMKMDSVEMGKMKKTKSMKKAMGNAAKYCLLVAMLLLGYGIASADDIYFPRYDETNNFDTWLYFSTNDTAITSGDFTLIARDSSGTLIGSTNPTIRAHGSYAIKLETAIPAVIRSNANRTGQLEIVGTDANLNKLNAFVCIKQIHHAAPCWIVPSFGVGVTTGNKYAPQ